MKRLILETTNKGKTWPSRGTNQGLLSVCRGPCSLRDSKSPL